MNRRQFLATTTVSALAAGSLQAAPPSPKIRVGQIGTRHGHASGKLATLRKFPEVFEIVGVVEPDAERRRRVENEEAYRGLTWLTEEQLFSTPGLKAVAVETEVGSLLATGRRCVEAGFHIHLDKPAGESLPEFQALLEAATTRSLVVQMGYMFRSNPGFQFLIKAVREGWLGRVFEVHAVMSKQIGQAERNELAVYPGGSMFELGCHLIDMLVTLLGKPDRITAHGRMSHPDQDKLVDNQLAVFDYPTATATIRSSMIEPFGGERRQFTVCGEEGSIEIYPLEPPKLRMALNKPRDSFRRGWQDVALPKSGGRYDGELLAFAKAIRGEEPLAWSAAHDLLVQKCVLKASGLTI